MHSDHSAKDALRERLLLDVLIVGAGLAGLSAAIAIAQDGHRVRILEAASKLTELGAGLQITPNASRILRGFSLPESFWVRGAEPTAIMVYSYRGKILAYEDDFDKNMREKYGAEFIDFHRADLQAALYERAKSLGVEVFLGQRAQWLNTQQGHITTENGAIYEADIVVAADGLWSRCRQLFQAVPDNPQPTGDLAYRIVLTLDQVKDPELKRIICEPQVKFWIGPNAHVVGYSLRAGTMYNLVLLVPDDLPPGVPRNAGSVIEMRELFKDWDPILTRFLDCVDRVEKWKLLWQKELPRWVSDSSNLVFMHVLVLTKSDLLPAYLFRSGDSCHPMLPYLAQGANSSIEDGAVLGMLISRLHSKADIPGALRMFEKLRKQRCDSIVQETFKQRHDFHLPDGEEQEKRDQLFLSQIGKSVHGPFPSRWYSHLTNLGTFIDAR